MTKRKSDREKERFAQSVLNGLSDNPRQLSSQWFYDARGSRLFEKICRQPEYYLTGLEKKILQCYSGAIAKFIGKGDLNLLELGCGNGEKVGDVIKSLLDFGDVIYSPIDISSAALRKCKVCVAKQFPHLKISPMLGEYNSSIRELSLFGRKKLVAFFGSSIGNFKWHEAEVFLNSLSAALNKDDFMLIGFDLMKDIKTMISAYSDKAGFTAEFNRNLLRRINLELGGNFKPENFEHHAEFNFTTRAMQSFLYSTVPQKVQIQYLNRKFIFEKYDSIHTESSGKYRLHEIAGLAKMSRFEVVRNFFDDQGYYALSLWQRK